MAAQNQVNCEPHLLPQVLLHRLPILHLPYLFLGTPFDLPFKSRLRTRFRLLDPCDSSEATHSFLSTHEQSVRVLLCVSPTPVNADTLRLLPSLECVVATSTGVDHIDLAECRRRGIVVTNAGSAFSESSADYAVVLLIDVLRKMSAADRYVRAGLWPVKGEYLHGSKVQLVVSLCLLEKAPTAFPYVFHRFREFKDLFTL